MPVRMTKVEGVVLSDLHKSRFQVGDDLAPIFAAYANGAIVDCLEAESHWAPRWGMLFPILFGNEDGSHSDDADPLSLGLILPFDDDQRDFLHYTVSLSDLVTRLCEHTGDPYTEHDRKSLVAVASGLRQLAARIDGYLDGSQ